MTTQARRITLVLLALASAATVAHAQSTPTSSAQPGERHPITTAMIALTLSTAETAITPEQVKLPAALTAASPSPDLVISSVERMGDRASRVKLSCRVQGQCLPFFATVNWTDTASAENAIGHLQTAAHGPQASQLSADRPLLRAGAHATLVIDSNRIHIRVPVVCLENGAVGHTVRVAGLDDRKQIYRAEVLSADSLKGSL